jgi:hypothetical protein
MKLTLYHLQFLMDAAAPVAEAVNEYLKNGDDDASHAYDGCEMD